jgi:subtilase family serine protease
MMFGTHGERVRLGLLCVGLLALAGGPPAALALPSRAANRAQRLCSTPRPGTAACLGMRLIAKSLTSEDLKANAVKQSHEAAGGASPKVTSKSVPAGLTPQNLHSAYSLPTETAGSATQTIGIVDAYNDPTAEADLGVYDTTFGLPACTTANGCFRKLNEQGKTSPLPAKNGEWSSEISLDLQMARAICQNCHIVLVEASSTAWGDLGTAVNTAASAGATEISNSYGGAEGSGYSSLGTYYNHPGVVVTVSSGDCGYFNQACTGDAAAANFPAGSPNVVAVGGTSLSHSGSTWGSTAWDDGGSGCSHVFSATLWQSDVENFSATGCGSGRSVADISAVGDPYTGVDVYDTTPAGSGDPTGWGVWGGTSAASPIVAAEWALGGGARGVSYPSATVYSHIGEEGDLYDVTSGSNGSCSGATSCKAHTGYDGPTGVGSPIALGAFTVAGTPADATAPSISGSTEQNQKLTASAGEWSASPTSLSYHWVLCNSSGASCTAISGATSSTLTVPASAVGSTIRVVVVAGNASGTGTAAESSQTALIASDVPAITGFTPSSGVTGSTVTIAGSAFTGASQVRFGNLSTTFTVLSSTAIEAVVPSGAAVGTVSVTTPVKSATSSIKFTPTLSVVSNTPGRAAVGATVTIKGLGFNSSSAVSFHGVAASSVTFVSATSLKAVVPAGASTGTITVTNSSAPVGAVHSAGNFVVA